MDGDYGGAIPLNISTLYRGQNKQTRIMLPSIARGLSLDTGKMFDMPPSDQAQIVLRLAQSWWFARELDNHPITAHAEQQRLRLDRLALAQHYGIPTGYLDLTDNFDVAAFFATCRETETGWQPAEEEGVGIVYRVELNRVKDLFELFKPLGPQPLPSPEEQKAWVVELPLIHSFDGWPVVSKLLFQQDKSVGQHFLEIFEGGKILFPPDPLANVAQEILKCREIPEELTEGALASLASDQFGTKPDQFSAVRQSLSNLTGLIDYRRLLHDQDVAPFLEDFEWRKRRLSDVKANVRPVRLELRHEHGDSSPSDLHNQQPPAHD